MIGGFLINNDNQIKVMLRWSNHVSSLDNLRLMLDDDILLLKYSAANGRYYASGKSLRFMMTESRMYDSYYVSRTVFDVNFVGISRQYEYILWRANMLLSYFGYTNATRHN